MQKKEKVEKIRLKVTIKEIGNMNLKKGENKSIIYLENILDEKENIISDEAIVNYTKVLQSLELKKGDIINLYGYLKEDKENNILYIRNPSKMSFIKGEKKKDYSIYDTEDLFINNKKGDDKEIKEYLRELENYEYLIELYKKAKEEVDFNDFCTLRRFLIILLNNKEEFRLEKEINYQEIENILKKTSNQKEEKKEDITKEIKEVKKSKKKRDNLKLIREQQSKRIKNILLEKGYDEKLIDKHINEIFSVNSPKDFIKIDEDSIIQVFKIKLEMNYL